MACKDCNTPCNTRIDMPCKVCELVDGDLSVKRVCMCDKCGAYICKKHQGEYMTRGIAALLNVAPEPVVEMAQSVIKKVKSSFKKKK